MTKIRINKPGRIDQPIAITDDISQALAARSPVAIGVSGGKDSCALAFATIAYLDSIGHAGPRVLIHSDLGRVEWKASLPTCEKLAERLGLELIVVRRAAGDMMDRWLTRWKNNVERYANLECVKLILPWSTPSMRFCTSELKTAIICRELIRRFPGQAIISAGGIRREESSNRAKAPITKPQAKLSSTKHKTTGIDWHPIIEWSETDVRAYLASKNFELHEAYTKYGMTRVSCAFCIMGSAGDLAASTTCPDNAEVYREMVDLEIASTFAFQGKYLGDVAPHLLTDDARNGVENAKLRAERREAAEARIPEHLLYEKGWPKLMPTYEEAVMLAAVRTEVAAAVGIVVDFQSPLKIIARYAELMAENARRQENA